jgi:hypothetical protein
MDQKNHHIEDEHIVYRLNLFIKIILKRNNEIINPMQQLKQVESRISKACKRKTKLILECALLFLLN